MSAASELRARAADLDARVERLERICTLFAGRAAHLGKHRRIAEAIVAQNKADRAATAIERCAFKAMGCRLAAARLEHHAARTAALADIANPNAKAA